MNDGGPAFPQPQFEGVNYTAAWDRGMGGMTLRDWFAGMVMSPMLVQAYGTTPDILAQEAYRYADAMLAEREKETP